MQEKKLTPGKSKGIVYICLECGEYFREKHEPPIIMNGDVIHLSNPCKKNGDKDSGGYCSERCMTTNYFLNGYELDFIHEQVRIFREIAKK
ncbi:MAG: hypothetical protein KJ623_02285 [Nanoarchaeota archaeon]|nr:hypothetical protein [Nanoarchaeota archaeon]MBU0963319.1 hypothetical protein [Nanoarchaeota archaeon]